MAKIQVWSKERGAKILKDGANFETYRAKYPSVIRCKHPSIKTLENWHSEGGCRAVDGCWTEPDGECPHGLPSWLLAFGMI